MVQDLRLCRAAAQSTSALAALDKVFDLLVRLAAGDGVALLQQLDQLLLQLVTVKRFIQVQGYFLGVNGDGLVIRGGCCVCRQAVVRRPWRGCWGNTVR